MDDRLLVQTILDLTSLDLADGLRHIHGDGAALRVRHEALRTEDAAQTADNAHHVRGRDDDVEVEPVFALDLRNQLLSADVIRAGLLGGLGLLAFGEHEDANLLAGAVRQHDSAANLLVGLTRIDAQTHGDLHGLVELGLRGLQGELHGLVRIIQLAAFDELRALEILLAMLHVYVPPCGTNGLKSSHSFRPA